MDQSIFRYTWRYSRREQIWLLFVVLASLPFYFLSLVLPKRIINGPIQGEGFASPGDTETAFRLAFDLPSWLGGASVVLFEGVEFGRIEFLTYLCLLFLAFVLINGWFKFYISTFKGRLGERMLRRLRFQLVDRLPADQRRVVEMRFGDGKAIQEVAAALGRSEGAIKQLQRRALENLRANLEGRHG